MLITTENNGNYWTCKGMSMLIGLAMVLVSQCFCIVGPWVINLTIFDCQFYFSKAGPSERKGKNGKLIFGACFLCTRHFSWVCSPNSSCSLERIFPYCQWRNRNSGELVWGHKRVSDRLNLAHLTPSFFFPLSYFLTYVSIMPHSKVPDRDT